MIKNLAMAQKKRIQEEVISNMKQYSNSLQNRQKKLQNIYDDLRELSYDSTDHESLKYEVDGKINYVDFLVFKVDCILERIQNMDYFSKKYPDGDEDETGNHEMQIDEIDGFIDTISDTISDIEEGK